MSGFYFQLEPVLRHRAEKATTAEQALALAHHEYHQRLSLLADTRQRLEEAFEEREDQEDVLGIAHLAFYRASLNTKIETQEDAAKLARKTVERKRHVAVKARQERQIMEKLKDKHYLYFRQEEAQREKKEVDELALYAYQRQPRAL